MADQERPTALEREGDEVAEEGLGRLLTLVDGVFAIAATLLVIEIALPDGTTSAGVGGALLRLAPHYFAYGVSFLVIARFWVVHHALFRYIGRVDPPMIWLNLVLLMFVAFLPFPTSVLGSHGDAPAAAVFYAATVTCVSALTALQWRYASRHPKLLRAGARADLIRRAGLRSATATLFFALSLPVAYVAPYVAEALWVLGYPVVRFAVGRTLESRRHA